MERKMITEQEVKQAYENVLTATALTQTAGFEYELAKEKLEVEVLKATADGRVVGSNDGARKAAALVLFEKQYTLKDELEALYKSKSNELALARIHLDCLRDCIRIEELAKN
jgi:hypothetical protein